MGCNRKVKLLISGLFRGWEKSFKKPLSLWVQLYRIHHGDKTDLLIEKQCCLILPDNFSVKGRMGSLVHFSDSRILLNRERLSSYCSFLSLRCATL